MRITYDEIRRRHPDPYPMTLVGREAKVVSQVVNIGIDAHLEACFCPDRGDRYEIRDFTLECLVSAESLPVLLRRLTEYLSAAEGLEESEDSDADVGNSLVGLILTTIGFTDEELNHGHYPYEIVSPVDEEEPA